MDDAEPTAAPLKHDRPAGSADSERLRLPEVAEQALFCPSCRYNLTGLPENRCPECGAAFDPVELARDDKIPWAARPSFRSFFATLRLANSNVAEFVRRAESGAYRAAAWKFALTCHAAAAVIFVVVFVALRFVVPAGRGPVRPMATLAVVLPCLWAGIAGCEFVLAGVLARLSSPAPRRGFAFWRRVAHYTAAYAMVSACPLATWLFPGAPYSGIAATVVLASAFGAWCGFVGQSVNAALRPAVGVGFGALTAALVGTASLVSTLLLARVLLEALGLRIR